MADANGESALHRDRAYIWSLGLLWVLPAFIVAVGYVLLPKDNASGQCEGIGFGCVPAPADTLLLMGVLASPFLFGAGVVAFAVIAVRRRRTRS